MKRLASFIKPIIGFGLVGVVVAIPVAMYALIVAFHVLVVRWAWYL